MIVTRFAPSPTGYLHLGHAYAALFAWHSARDEGGRFLLRIEDIDAGRARPTFEAALLDDLAWLGLDWEMPVRRQSEHFADYRAALDRLAAQGVLYPCFCTRADIRAEIERAGAAPHLAPRGRTARRSIRHLPRARRRRCAPSASPRARPTHCASTWPRRRRSPARSPGTTASRARSRRGPPCSATSCWRAATRRPAIISPSRSTIICRASPWSRAARICSRRPTCIGCSRPCSASTCPTIIITTCCTDDSRQALRQAQPRGRAQGPARRGFGPAQVRAMAGFPD